MKILLLNPNIDAQHKICARLQSAGAALLIPAHAEEGWKMVQLHGASLDLAIIHREGKAEASDDGEKLLAKIKADPTQGDLPIIFTSSMWDENRFAEHQQSPQGVNAYLHWPFEDDQLIETIETMFGNSIRFATVGTASVTIETPQSRLRMDPTKDPTKSIPVPTVPDVSRFSVTLTQASESTIALDPAPGDPDISLMAQLPGPLGSELRSNTSISTQASHTLPGGEPDSIARSLSLTSAETPAESSALELSAAIPVEPPQESSFDISKLIPAEELRVEAGGDVGLELAAAPDASSALQSLPLTPPPAAAAATGGISLSPASSNIGGLGLQPPVADKTHDAATEVALLAARTAVQAAEVARAAMQTAAPGVIPGHAAAASATAPASAPTLDIGAAGPVLSLQEDPQATETASAPAPAAAAPEPFVLEPVLESPTTVLHVAPKELPDGLSGLIDSDLEAHEKFEIDLQIKAVPEESQSKNELAELEDGTVTLDEHGRRVKAAAPAFISGKASDDEEDFASELPYLFSKAITEEGAKFNSPVFSVPVGDAVVPGGASSEPDLDTLKKYLMLREQDVAVLSNQLKSAVQQVKQLQKRIREEKGRAEDFEHTVSEQKKRIEEFEKEKALALQGLQAEIDELKFESKTKTDKARALEMRVKEATDEIERLKERVRVDIRKIRVREKELENKLEIVRKDSEALITAREAKIMELKRKLDLLEFNVDLLQDQNAREKENSAQLKERLAKAAQVVRVAGGLLDAQGKAALGLGALEETEAKEDKGEREAS